MGLVLQNSSREIKYVGRCECKIFVNPRELSHKAKLVECPPIGGETSTGGWGADSIPLRLASKWNSSQQPWGNSKTEFSSIIKSLKPFVSKGFSNTVHYKPLETHQKFLSTQAIIDLDIISFSHHTLIVGCRKERST